MARQVRTGGINRRDFLIRGGAAGAALALGPALRTPRARAAVAPRLSGAAYAAKFATPLPRPARIQPGRNLLAMEIREFQQQVLDSSYPPTRLYGYAPGRGAASWPGPTLVARRDERTKVQWRNELPRTRLPLEQAHLLPVDTNNHLADPLRDLPVGNLPVVTHLHGAHVDWESDGHPESWFTQSWTQKGPMWKRPVYEYENSQRAGTLWYHDHTLGITRLNVFAGLAGMYLIRDDEEDALIGDGVLPAEEHEIELVLQDRWFRTDGQLDLTTTASPPGGIVLSIFGDFMMVNGAPWPVLDVEPRKYRFRLLNGSDSRFYVLELDGDAPFIQVGTELGLCERAVALDRLVVGVAERYDLVIDFSDHAGQELVLRNVGPDGVFRGFRNTSGTVTNDPADTPFGFGGPSNPASTGMVMKFRVGEARSSAPDATVEPGTVLGSPMPMHAPTNTRGVIASGGRDQLDRTMALQGTLADGTLMWHDPATETPAVGATEVWEIYNAAPIAHPIHVHLVDFRVLDRQPFTFTSEPKTMHMHDGSAGTGTRLTSVTRTGSARPAEPHERGPKDTVICYPNEVTRIVATFDKPGNYVWHCHILHHEDHDMMRPLVVGGATGAPMPM